MTALWGRRWRYGSALIASLVVCWLAGPASAEPVQTFAGASGPGPARYDRVSVERFGDPAASGVLILVPGLEAGAGEFAPVARALVTRVPDLQVWAYDPR